MTETSPHLTRATELADALEALAKAKAENEGLRKALRDAAEGERDLKEACRGTMPDELVHSYCASTLNSIFVALKEPTDD